MLSALLSFFSFVCAVLLVLVVLFLFSSFQNKSAAKKSVSWYLLAFFCCFLYSLAVLDHYLYPSPEVAKNADFHILAHQGYSFQDSLQLISSTQPTQALWDRYEGECSLKRLDPNKPFFQLKAKDLHYPVYLRDTTDQYAVNNRFRLVNKSQYSIVFNKFIELKIDSSEQYLRLQIDQKNSAKADYIIQTSQEQTADTSNFDKVIYMYYSLGGILGKSKYASTATALWDECYLLREYIGSPLKAIQKTVVNNQYCFFLSKTLLANREVYYRTDSQGSWRKFIPTNEFIVNFSAGATLFCGLGKQESDVIQVSNDTATTKSMISFNQVKKYPFNTKGIQLGEMKAYLVSSQFPESIGENDRGKYLDYFDRSDNLNHISAGISYVMGDTKQAMRLEYTDYQLPLFKTKSVDNKQVNFQLHTRNQAASLTWNMAFIDRRVENPLKAYHLQLFLSTFFLLVVLRYTLLYRSATLSRMEMSMYLILYTFLLIRLYLQWRVATLYPLSDITAKQLAIITNALYHFKWTTIITGGFWLIWLLALMNGRFTKKLSFKGWQLLVLIGMSIGSFALAASGQSFFERISNLLVPIVLYYILDVFCIQFLFNKKNRWLPTLLRYFKEDIKKLESRKAAIRVLLLVGTFFMILINDAGYGVMFLVFILIHHVLLGIVLNRYGKHSVTIPLFSFRLPKLLAFVISTVLFIFLLIWQASLISWSIEHLTWTVWGVMIGVLILGGYWQWKSSDFFWNRQEEIRSSLLKWPKLSVSIYTLSVIGLFAFALSNYPQQLSEKYTYIKYRASVLNEPVDDLIMERSFRSKYVQSILQSSHNQWLIYYLVAQDDKTKSNYMRIQPHFHHGASHITQASDLVIPRYLIAEHSEALVLALISCFALFAIIYYRSIDAHYRVGETMISQRYFSSLGISVLLFTTALFVWMTTTNRFTFFGQDFPLLPIASKITLVLSLSLFLLMLFLYNPLHEQKSRIIDQLKVSKIRSFQLIYLLGAGTMLTAVFLINTQKMSAKYYNISKVIEEATSEVEQLNTAFLEFQNQYPHNYLDTVSEQQLLANFHQVDIRNRITKYRISKHKKLLRTAYESYFMNEQRDLYNPTELFHLRKEEGRYLLEVNRRFFFLKTPGE